MSVNHTLDNPVWSSLVERQSIFAIGNDLAKRFSAAVAPFAAVANHSDDALEALETIVEHDDQIYLLGTELKNTDVWSHISTLSCDQMVFEGQRLSVDGKFEFIKLGPDHVPQMLRLTDLVFRGYFRPRTIEMGHYFGIFENDQLIAMAGERMATAAYREVSAVCTHPDFQGRGLASRLVSLVVNKVLDRGEQPFLHVGSVNKGAIGIYERLGFKTRRTLDVRLYEKH